MRNKEHKDTVERALSGFSADKVDREFLRTMYQTKVQQFLSDNGRIWVTGSFLIPLSLVPFGGVIGHSLSRWELLLLAGGSVLLISSWLIIAEAHRNFQNASNNWMAGIEHAFGVNSREGMEKASDENLLSSLMDRRGTVRILRYALWSLIVTTWIVLVATAPEFN